MRVLCLVIVAVLLTGGSALAQGRRLMLDEEPSRTFNGLGWTFLFLSVATLAYGAKVLGDSDDDLDRADQSFTAYQSAGSASQATSLRTATNSALNDARTNEERANVALFLAVLFGITSYYSFNPEDLPDNSLTVTRSGILFSHRF